MELFAVSIIKIIQPVNYNLSWIFQTTNMMSIQEYYSGFLNLWSEYMDLSLSNVPAATVDALQQVFATRQRSQSIMKLRPEFEAIRSSLMNRNPIPSLDVCFGQLLREEQRMLANRRLRLPLLRQNENLRS